jgi:hypothetical protein
MSDDKTDAEHTKLVKPDRDSIQIAGDSVAEEERHGDLLRHHPGHYRSVEEEKQHEVPTYYRCILTTLPLFMGYAGMIVLQHHIKERLDISDDNAHMSTVFSAAVSLLYVGNLIMRLMHNVVFTCLAPRYRVMLAFLLMTCSHLILFFAYYVADSKNVVWTFFAYLLSGIAIGSFESNLMSCLTPLGHGSKSWAVLGIPVGFNLVSVGFFILFAVWPANAFIEGGSYVVIGICNIIGLLFFYFVVPYIPFEASKDNARKFLSDMATFRLWVPTIWRHCIALMADMFCVSLFSSLVLYIYDVEDLPIWNESKTTMPKNAFQALFNLCSFLGDFTSRRLAYRDKPRNPLFFLVLSVCGAVMILSKTALVAPIGIFLVMFANGSVYAHSTRFIDNAVDDRYNLAALSMWLFVGDIGSVVGSNLVSTIRKPIGPVYHAHGTSHVVANVTQALSQWAGTA